VYGDGDTFSGKGSSTGGLSVLDGCMAGMLVVSLPIFSQHEIAALYTGILQQRPLWARPMLLRRRQIRMWEADVECH